MQFQDDVAAGVTLVRPALQSPDYVIGTSGWAVKIDGSAEFNDVTIRGGTTVSGTALYYDGPPALGSLFLAIASAPGADDYGNPYSAGLTIGNNAQRQVHLTYDTEGGFIELPVNDGSELTTASISVRRLFAASSSQQIFLQLASATQNVTGGTCAVRLMSASVNAATAARFEVYTDPAGVIDLVLTANHIQTQVLPSTPSGNSALYVQGPAGHAGFLLRVSDNGSNRLTVGVDGTTQIAGSLGVAGALSAGNVAVSGLLTAARNCGTTSAVLAASVSVDVSVVFTTPFATVPSVTATIRGVPAGTSALIIRLVSTSTTGFTVRVSDATGVARTATVNVDWIALA